MVEQSRAFDLVTIHPPLVYGPVSRSLESLNDLNTSNRRLLAMIQGRTRQTGLPPTVVYIFADVRDVAMAHVRALEVPEAGGERFLITGGHYSNKIIADTIRQNYPHLSSKLPPVEEIKDDTPSDIYGYNNDKSRLILGLEYRSIHDCIKDTISSLLVLEGSCPEYGVSTE